MALTLGHDASGAIMSNCRQYRYALWRVWDQVLPYALFVMLNPSTADEHHNDATIRRIIAFVQAWGGYGGVGVVNLFALRSTDPAALRKAADPIGPMNSAYQCAAIASRKCGLVVAAWGQHGTYLGQSAEFRKRCARPLHYLRLNAGGQPAHPLYLPSSLTPVLWSPEHA